MLLLVLMLVYNTLSDRLAASNEYYNKHNRVPYREWFFFVHVFVITTEFDLNLATQQGRSIQDFGHRLLLVLSCLR